MASELADYPPGATVQISASGFAPNETVCIKTTEDNPDFRFVQNDTVVAGSDGSFVYAVTISTEFIAQYRVRAWGLSSGNYAVTTFTDSGEDYRHWADLSPANWQNGTLMGTNSTYGEGEVVPHFFTTQGLTVGQTYGFNIYYDFYDTSSGGFCGFSGFGEYNADRTTTTTGLPTPVGAPTADALPGGPSLPGGFGNFYTNGANVTAVTAPSGSGIQRIVGVTFVAGATRADFYWGLRLATPGDIAGCQGSRAWPGASLQTNVGSTPTISGVTAGNMRGGGGTLQINPKSVTPSISGIKWNDLDGDGTRDAGEPVIQGWQVRLCTTTNCAAGTVVATDTTTAAGEYSLKIPGAGTYYVVETPQSGWVQTFPASPGYYGPIVYTVDNKGNFNEPSQAGKNFGNWTPGSISGVKYNDADNDGLFGAGDTTVNGITIRLCTTTNCAAGSVVATTVTASGGTYSFATVAPGTYYVLETVPSGTTELKPVAGYNGPLVISSTSATTFTGQNFLNRSLGTISGSKFLDADGNGAFSAGDTKVGGITIKLCSNATCTGGGDPIATTTTSSVAGTLGQYSFTNLALGTYFVVEGTPPAGTAQILPASGSYQVTLTSGAPTATGKDFLNQTRGSIAGQKFNDRNGNGTDVGAGEEGLPSWTIFIDGNSNSTLDGLEVSTSTAANGTYSFSNLPPGTYRICEVSQTGWVQTSSPVCWSVVLSATSATNETGKDFGNQTRGSISGTKFIDTDGTTTVSAGDTPLQGVTIKLCANATCTAGGDPITSTTTAANGTYSFSNLIAGTYFVREVVPGGSIEVLPSSGSFGPITISAASPTTSSGNNFLNAAPALTITKSVTESSYSSTSDVLHYSYKVENTGNVTLAGPFAVFDDKTSNESCPATATLAPGAFITCTSSYSITVADLNAGSVTNHAYATGSYNSSQVTSNTDQKTVTAIQSPELTLDKSATEADYDSTADTIHYTFDVTNTGNVSLAGPVTITDDQTTDESCPDVDTVGNLDGFLDPGETITCTASHGVTQGDLNAGSITNKATAHAGTTDSNEDSVTVDAIQSPALTLVKKATEANYDSTADTIHYTFDVTNSGNVSLAGPVTITDDQTTDESCPDVDTVGNLDGFLDPGETITCTASHGVTQGDLNFGSITNTATAHADGTDSAEDSVTVDAIQVKSVDLAKTATLHTDVVTPDNRVDAGDKITYGFTVTNTGNVTLTGQDLDDALLGLTDATCGSTTLAPGAFTSCTVDYTITQADINAGTVHNSATACADPPTGDEVCNTDTTDTVLTQVKAIDVTKEVSTSASGPWLDANTAATALTVSSGDTVYYRFTVKNTGNVTLSNVRLTDNKYTFGAGECVQFPLATLAPNGSSNCTISRVLTAPVTNTATAKGAFGGQDVQDTDDAVVDVTPIDLTVSKTAAGTFKRTYTWNITKTADKSSVLAMGGTSATVNYTVTATQTGFVDSDWVVSGEITVTNPNSFVDFTGVTVTDTVDNGGTCTVTNGTSRTVPKSGNIKLAYSCTYSSKPAYSGTNTATATWDKTALHTPHDHADGTQAFTIVKGTSVNQTIHITDTFEGTTTSLGTATATDGTPFTTFTKSYSRSLAAPAGACKTYNNTAKIVETNASASWAVRVCGSMKTGAKTIGFWHNKNGQSIITGGASASGVCKSGTWLRQFAPFQDLSATANCKAVADYYMTIFKAADSSGTAMNAMLKAQMLATALDVYFSSAALGGDQIGAGAPIGGITIDLTKICKMIDSSGGTATCSGGFVDASSAFGGATSLTVMQMLTYAASQSNVGGTTWYGNVKSKQELAKNAFDAINNEAAFSP